MNILLNHSKKFHSKNSEFNWILYNKKAKKLFLRSILFNEGQNVKEAIKNGPRLAFVRLVVGIKSIMEYLYSLFKIK